MRGRRKALEREYERDIALAWHVENFSRSGKKLRELDYYLKKARAPKVQTAEEVFAIFNTLAGRGLVTMKQRPN